VANLTNDLGSQPAFPEHAVTNSMPGAAAIRTAVTGGLTKRELFAAMAMQGWLAGCANAYSEFTGLNVDTAVKASVKVADALLTALRETP
jgi:hypothetical protein